jgi:hypothetical protein
VFTDGSKTHLEGSYCIEWREDGKRRRLSIPQRHQVLERARLKSLELEGLPVPQQVLPPGRDQLPAPGISAAAVLGPSLPWPTEGGNLRLAIEGIVTGVGTYLRELAVTLEAAARNGHFLAQANLFPLRS